MRFSISQFVAAACFLVVIVLSPILNGQISISVVDPTINVGTNEVVTFRGSGVSPVDKLTFVAVVDQFTGSGPDIVSITGLGEFEGISPSFCGGMTPTDSPKAVVALFNKFGASRAIDGTDLVSIAFDTSSLTVGDAFNINLQFGAQSTVFSGSGAEVPASFAHPVQINVTAEIICGDVDQDGDVDFLDIDPFIDVLMSGAFLAEADVNKDGVVDFADIPPFISILTGPAPEDPPPVVRGEEILVSSVAEFNSALSQVQPGDSIVLRNGTYTDQEFEFAPINNGTEALPIRFRAEAPGQVILNGSSRLFISGDWLVASGFNFDSGSLDSGSVVEFRARNNSGEATNSRFTNSQIIDCNPADESTRYFWVSLYGQNNRVDHNKFSGQNHSGVTVVVWRDSPDPDFHLIDNNHFVDRPAGTGNGFETIRIGTGGQALSDSFTTVENNLFERVDGEIEAISVKAGGVAVRNNTFRESAGTVTLRSGQNNIVEGNYFIGKGKDLSGGVRVVGEGHTVVNNYFEGLDGRAGGAISIAAGGAAQVGAHAQVKNLLIANNTIVNLNDGAAIAFSDGLGNDNGAGIRTLLAEDVTIVNNLISSTGDPLFAGAEGTGFIYLDNIAFGAALGAASGQGILVSDPRMIRGMLGLLRLSASSPAIDGAYTGSAGGHFPPAATGFIDIDGQTRDLESFDIGADEYSSAQILKGPLTVDDVGNCFQLFAGVDDTGVIESGLIIQASDFTSALDPNSDGDTFSVQPSDTAYSGNVVVAPGGTRIDLGDTQDAVLSYSLQFAEPGTYTAYYRARGFSSGSNSFYTPTAFASEPSEIVTITEDGTYRWEKGDLLVVTSVDVGELLEFRIGKREQGSEVDVIVFHLDGDLSDAELDALF